jgi:very-long-chain enoyl-CoA reductase
LRDQSTIYIKNLGPQIAWRTVFLVEYLGPIIIHPLIYFLRPYLYKDAPEQASQVQATVLIATVAHFIKREAETLFIHRFSAATMPLTNIFKNSAHYWLLSGILMAATCYSPTSVSAKPASPALLYPGILLFALGEFLNLQTHLTLRNLRSSGGTERGIPEGPLFDLVTCPNYFTEIIAWLGIFLISGLNWGVVVFLTLAAGQMGVWAKKKEKRYRKEFGDKYRRKRFVMFPGIW